VPALRTMSAAGSWGGAREEEEVVVESPEPKGLGVALGLRHERRQQFRARSHGVTEPSSGVGACGMASASTHAPDDPTMLAAVRCNRCKACTDAAPAAPSHLSLSDGTPPCSPETASCASCVVVPRASPMTGSIAAHVSTCVRQLCMA
jgi:hypothetical protein